MVGAGGVVSPDFPAARALTGLTPVLAVGSNAAPAVLAAKLHPALRTGVPTAPVEVNGLGVGHSAHVSLGGYVAAAPYLREPCRVRLAVSWLDPDQLELLDGTEPNYRRVPLPGSVHCQGSDGPVAAVEVYDSRHGVLGRDGAVLPVGSQAEVVRWLVAALPEAAGWGLEEDPPGRLAEAGLRERIRTALDEAGLAMPSGLPAR